MKEPKPITFAELMAEVDRIKGNAKSKRYELTSEQQKFLFKCRSKKPPLSFEQIRLLWNKMPDWQPYANGDNIRKLYKKISGK